MNEMVVECEIELRVGYMLKITCIRRQFTTRTLKTSHTDPHSVTHKQILNCIASILTATELAYPTELERILSEKYV